MTSLFRIALLTLLAVSIGPSLAAAQQNETRRFKSRAYDITTDLPNDLAREVAAHMDAVHAEYTRRFSAYAKRNNEPLRLWVFADRDGYQRFLAGHEINAIGSAGMFFRTDDADGLAAYLQPRTKDAMLETLRHEGMHQFLYQRIGDNLPPWLNEGMAEWFGYALETERGFEMGLGDPRAINRLHERTEDGSLVSLGTLLSLTQSEWNARLQAGSNSGEYDAAWSVVHFLAYAENGRYARLLDQLLHLFWQGWDAERATEKVFGGDLATMDAKWKDYVRDLQPDELYAARDVLEVYAVVLWAMRVEGVRPKTPQEFEAAIEEHGDSLDLPGSLMTSTGEREVSLADDAWWRQPLRAARNGRVATVRYIPVRGDDSPPEIEIRGLKRRATLKWNINDKGLPEPTVEYR